MQRTVARRVVAKWTGLLVMICISIVTTYGVAAQANDLPKIARANFTSDGSVMIPVEYREWSHVGTRVNSGGINILDGLPIKAPEILNAYVEPSAMAAFQKTGKWPNGTQIVKEFSSIAVGANCDQHSFICQNSVGRGIFQAGYIGLGMMIKDEKRFPDAPGHWGYFSFGHKPLPYDSTAALMPANRCVSCHVNLAADTDYVISRAHIGLARHGSP